MNIQVYESWDGTAAWCAFWVSRSQVNKEGLVLHVLLLQITLALLLQLSLALLLPVLLWLPRQLLLNQTFNAVLLLLLLCSVSHCGRHGPSLTCRRERAYGLWADCCAQEVLCQ